MPHLSQALRKDLGNVVSHHHVESIFAVCAAHLFELDPHMSFPKQPEVKLTNREDYREGYCNSVQVRVSVWDFFLSFGTVQQNSPEEVLINNFQGVYISPQQAKALSSILQQNVASYEQTFGEIKLDPKMVAGGPIH